MNMLKKIYLMVNSIFHWMLIKLLYRNKAKMHIVNAIRGRVYVELMNKSSMFVGRFLMSRGPLYIKFMENAQLRIGDNVFFNHNCSITCAQKIEIGNNCMIANNVVIVDHNHVVTSEGTTSELVSKGISIGNSVWLGANVTITKGVRIGDGAVIGANSVVLNDVEAHSVYAGVPARKIRKVEKRKKDGIG